MFIVNNMFIEIHRRRYEKTLYGSCVLTIIPSCIILDPVFNVVMPTKEF